MNDNRPAPKRPRREAKELPTHSKEFPEGYGDFVFKSMDGVIFHFPRFLLSHISPVFRDMYQIGDDNSTQDIVSLTEDYATLEFFLRLIDPAKETPRIEQERLVGALQAAEKYQIDSIFKWFETEVALSLLTTDYFTLSDPMLFLSLALRYDLRKTIGISLREALKCPLGKLSDGPHIESRLWRRITALRAQRTQRLVEIIHECPEDPYKHDMDCYEARTTDFLQAIWKQLASVAVIEYPSWSAIVQCIKSSDCPCIPLDHVEQKREVKEMEDMIPDFSMLSSR
jgi:hypothetical protein